MKLNFKVIVLMLLLISGFHTSVSAQQIVFQMDSSIIDVSGTSNIHNWVMHGSGGSGDISSIQGDNSLKVSFTIPVRNLKSERGTTMDEKAYNAFKSEENPDIHLSIEKLEELKSGTSKVHCKLQMAGKYNYFFTEATLQVTETSIVAEGSFPINFNDYDMEAPTAMWGQIVCGDKVEVKYKVYYSSHN